MKNEEKTPYEEPEVEVIEIEESDVVTQSGGSEGIGPNPW